MSVYYMKNLQERQCTYDVTLRHVRVNNVAMEER